VANGHITSIGNPNREGGSYSTRSIAHKYPKISTITPLLPR
jgi:hypothetical protein